MTELDFIIANKMQFLRLKNEYSTQQLANKLEISYSLTKAYLHGRTRLPTSIFLRMLKIFKTPFDKLKLVPNIKFNGPFVYSKKKKYREELIIRMQKAEEEKKKKVIY